MSDIEREGKNVGDTIAMTPRQRLEEQILIQVAYLIQAYIDYSKFELQNSIGNISKVRSALAGLIVHQYGALRKTYDKVDSPEHLAVWKKICSVLDLKQKLRFSEVFDIVLIIQEWLYQKNILKLDDREIRDTMDIWNDNEFNGFT